MLQASFTITPSTGFVTATDFVVTNNTQGTAVQQYTWDLGDGNTLYNIASPILTYKYPGVYTVTLCATDFNGNTSAYSHNISVDLAYRDYIKFSQIPDQFADPGRLTNTPFKIEVISANPDKPLIVDLFAVNSNSTPHQFIPQKWSFLNPTWKFLDKDYNIITNLNITPTPIYSNNRVVAVSGAAEFYFVDSISNGDPIENCPVLITATLQTSGFNYPVDSNIYPYDSYANNQAVRVGIIWQVNDLLPNTLRITGNYIDPINPVQWKGIKIPALITCHADRSLLMPGASNIVSEPIFNYPKNNSIGSQAPITLTLSGIDSNEYSIEEAPLYFQATDNNNSRIGGYIFTTLTCNATGKNTAIIASGNTLNSIPINTDTFPYPAGYAPNPIAWISNPQKNTLNKITLIPDSGNCKSINSFRNNKLLVDGIVKEINVPAITSTDTFNYSMSGFSGIYGIAIDPRDYSIVAADAELDRLYRISSSGEILKTFNLSSLGDYNPNKKLLDFWTWKTPTPQTSATKFLFYKPTLLSPNPANYIVTVGGAIQPTDAIKIFEDEGVIFLDVNTPIKTTTRQIDVRLLSGTDIINITDTIEGEEVTFSQAISSIQFDSGGIPTVTISSLPEFKMPPEDIDLNVIQIFNPSLPLKYSSSLMYWTTSSPVPTNTYSLTGAVSPSLSSNPGYYIVSVDGVLQQPTSYNISNADKTITFSENLPENTTVHILYIPNILPPATWTETFTTSISTFPLTNNSNYVLDKESGFIINAGGVLQSPETYYHDIEKQALIFNTPLPINVPITVTQITVPESVNNIAAYTPAYVSLDGDFNIWVSLFNSVSVLKFDPEFNLLLNTAPANIHWPERNFTVLPPPDFNYLVSRFGDASNITILTETEKQDWWLDDEYFLKPPVVETDKDNNCWVSYAHPLCSILVKYSNSGETLLQIPTGLYSTPMSLSIAPNNNLWVTNYYESVYSDQISAINSFQLLDTTTGNVIRSVQNRNLARPSYTTIDRNNNLWFIFGKRNLGFYNTTTNLLTAWTINPPISADNQFTPLSLTDPLIPVVTNIDPLDVEQSEELPETETSPPLTTILPNIVPSEDADISELKLEFDDEMGGLAVDAFNRVWIIDSFNNYIWVIYATPNFSSLPIRAFKVIPDVTLGYYIDLQTGSTYTKSELNTYRSAQATGDWTGNKWYQKYATPEKLATTAVTGKSDFFDIYEFINSNQIRRVNESFNNADYLKSLVFSENFKSYLNLFDGFFEAAVGTGALSGNEDLGQIVYERIANFTTNHADIDTCNIDQLLSLANETGVGASKYSTTYPTDIRNMLDIASVPRAKLWGVKNTTPVNFDCLCNLLNTETTLLTAGTKIILRNKISDTLNLVTVPLQDGLTVYPLRTFEGYGFSQPILDNYLFYTYKPNLTDEYIENIIDWESPYTTLSPNASTAEQWYGDNGIIETTFRYLLTKNLFPK